MHYDADTDCIMIQIPDELWPNAESQQGYVFQHMLEYFHKELIRKNRGI
jgi:hypothetical protein